MTPEVETTRIVARWLVRLVPLTRPPADGPMSAPAMNDLAEMLARDLPSAAFTTESLHAVLRGQEWFPAYAVISERVREWWDAHKPLSAPAAPRKANAPHGLSETDRAWLRYWHANRPAAAARQSLIPREELAGMDPVQTPLGNLTSLVRSKSPAAWQVISGENLTEQAR